MKQIIGIIVAGTLLALVLSSCGSSDAKTGDPTQSQQQTVVIPVKIEEVRLSPFVDAVTATGIVKAYDEVRLSPEEGGVVKEWLVEKGRPVKKGQLIGLLKDDVARSSYEAAEAQHQLAELNFQKQLSVYGEQAISELQLKSAQYNRDAAKAQAELMKARWERMRLRSPIDGILNERYFQEGEFAPPGVPIAHLVNTTLVKVAGDVSERNAGSIGVGTPVLITVDALPNDTLAGKIAYVGAALSASNRTLLVEVVLSNPRGTLKPEMVARLKIMRGTKTSALLISENIVQQVDRNKFVVFVENDGKAEERVVKLGSRNGTFVEILSGLKPGDNLIVVGFQKLVNGQAVVVNG